MVVEEEDLLKPVEMVTSRVVMVVVEAVPVVVAEELVHQSLLHLHHTSLVDLMVAVEPQDLHLVVVTKVVVAVVLLLLVIMLMDLDHKLE